jgi:hypothetical protein
MSGKLSELGKKEIQNVKGGCLGFFFCVCAPVYYYSPCGRGYAYSYGFRYGYYW